MDCDIYTHTHTHRNVVVVVVVTDNANNNNNNNDIAQINRQIEEKKMITDHRQEKKFFFCRKLYELNV